MVFAIATFIMVAWWTDVSRIRSKPREQSRAWPYPLAIVLSAALLLCALLMPVYLSSSATDAPHEYGPNVAEMWTGLGTLLLVGTALLAGILTLRQIGLERHDRSETRKHEAKVEVEARHTRYAETYTTVSQRWNETLFREVRLKIRSFYGDGGPENVKKMMLALREAYDPDYFELLTALDFFENLAILVKFRAISFNMADNALGVVTCQYWAMLKPFIDWQRANEPQDEAYYTLFEDLVTRISMTHGYHNPWKDSNPPPAAKNISSASASATANANAHTARQTFAVVGDFSGTIE